MSDTKEVEKLLKLLGQTKESEEHGIHTIPEAVMYLFLAFLSIPIDLFLSTYVLTVLWGWFMVTTFGLPVLGFASALGMLMVVRFATFRYAPPDPEKNVHKILVRVYAYAILRPLFALGVGYLVHLAM